MTQDPRERSVWRQQGRWWRVFARIWLPFTTLFLIGTLFRDDVHWGTQVSAVCNFVAGLGFMGMARIGSSADYQGIQVTQLRTRRLPWSTVEGLEVGPVNGRATAVRAKLKDGTTVPLPGVPAADAPLLQELRAGQPGPPRVIGRA
ncbi:PH domain-containing protein [uncultured Serinicoccus sp.]|uniref:PH domain-containing protein n=1 Tax=uncultured Serinicoccus sp. TaxID=735514 RepID=UPI0034238678